MKLIPREDYEKLRKLLPRDRIPWSAMHELPGFQEAKKEILGRLLDDARVRVPLNAYAGQNKDAYGTFFREADHELSKSLREDVGYAEEARTTHTVSMVCHVFSLLSRLSGQQRASASLQRLYSRDRSREARMDRAQQASQGNGWTPDI